MQLCRQLLVTAVAVTAIVGCTAGSALADTGVHVTNPGAYTFHSSSSVVGLGGTPAFSCDVTMTTDIDTGGTLSNVSFTILPGAPSCAAITATSTGGYICSDANGDLYLDENLTLFVGGSPVAGDMVVGDIDAAGDVLDFNNAPITPSGILSIDATFDITSEDTGEPLAIDSTEDACPA